MRRHDPAWQTDKTVATDTRVLYDAMLQAALPLPFGLAVANETPASARKKLSDDVSWDRPAEDGSRSVTYFLKDLRVVIVHFRPGLAGIETVKLTRLFSWPDWRERKN